MKGRFANLFPRKGSKTEVSVEGAMFAISKSDFFKNISPEIVNRIIKKMAGENTEMHSLGRVVKCRPQYHTL